MRPFALPIGSLAALFLGTSSAFAVDLALIISNETYDNASNIARVERNHERLVADFTDQGYRVIAGQNLNRQDMQELLLDFEGFLPGADKVVVYYAGHLLNGGTQTWLAPIDLTADSQVSVAFDAPSLTLFMDLLAAYPGRSALFLGSREEGFEPTGALDTGIGAIDIPQGLLVVSGDTDATFSVLANEFLSGGSAADIAAETDAGVVFQGLISPDLLLTGTGGVVAPPSPNIAILAEKTFWALTETGDTVRDYEDYLRRYPAGTFADVAKARIAALNLPQIDPAEQAEMDLGLSSAERRRIQENLTVLGYNPRGVDGVFGLGSRTAIKAWQRNEKFAQTGFLNADQVALMSRNAKIRRDEIAAESDRQRREQAAADAAFWRATGANGKAADLRAYLGKYPDGMYAAEAKSALAKIEQDDRVVAERAEQLAWDTARFDNTVQSYQKYLSNYPRGVFADIAWARIDALNGQSNSDANKAELQAIEANLGLNKSSRMLVERRLTSMNFSSGNVDGVFDSATRRAIRAFQQSQRLEVTGYLNANTVRQLIVASSG